MSRGVNRIEFPIPARDSAFDEIIDVRSPGEFALDHISGAVNLPVLDDGERARVGTIYKRESKFSATKIGAALVSKNIGVLLESHFSEKPADYRALIYCWRGGQRSGSLATVLDSVGWDATVLEGGYRAYRRAVVATLEERAGELDFRILNGLTGSGKTKILHAAAEQGGQVLDLEALANHRGSVFGGDWENPQPKQKRFESRIYDRLIDFEAARPVFVEAESPKIGRLNIPISLWKVMREAPVVEVRASLETRVDFLLSEYESWLATPDRVCAMLDHLAPFHGVKMVERWQSFCESALWRELVRELLAEHYDRNYQVGGKGHYLPPDRVLDLPDFSQASIASCARALFL